MAASVTRYYGQLLSCTISEKTNGLILRKFSDGRADRQTDESDFIEHCPTNDERPKTIHLVSKHIVNKCYFNLS